MHTRARNRRPSTIDSYLTVGRTFVAYLSQKGTPTAATSITCERVENFIADLGDRVSPSTTAKHYRSLQQLFRWLAEDREMLASPMQRMSPPAVPEQPVPILTDDDLSRLLAVCKGPTFENRRDEAIIRLFVDTGMRASELIGLRLDDLDREQSLAFVEGKGGRGRACPYGSRTADCLRRYLRARARHPMAGRTDALWLGAKGPVTDSGIRQMLERLGAEVRRDGPMVGTGDSRRAHPAAVESRQQRITLARLLAALRLPAGEAGDTRAGARPQRRVGARGVYGIRGTVSS
ncbi:MAG: tyrosine-type recombinase/integrase [Actinomycetota bacterium]|nr:tyrosine-type recombinase/integrase [Actinomycetota bacterium]